MERSKAKTKKSFDITNENKEYLKEYAIRSNQSPNQAFNDVLYALLSMEAKVKESIAKYCLQQADLIQSRIDSNTERSFHDSLDIKAVAQYMNLAYVLVPGISYEDTKKPWKKVIPIKDGHVEFAEKGKWVILKEINNPSECRYAGVVELEKKTGEFLHGLYFYDDKRMSPDRVSASVRKTIYHAFCKEIPDFREIVCWDEKEIKDEVPAKCFYQIQEKQIEHEVVWMQKTNSYDFPAYGAYIVREEE